jgi:Uma2 family endonuclease
MAISQTQPKKTAADWAKLPEGYKYQLIDGEFVEWPSMTLREHDARMEIGLALYQHVKSRKLGEAMFVPFDVHLTDCDIYQPDIIFVSNENLHYIEEDGVHGPPDLVIEVLSRSTAGFDLLLKKDGYEKFGVKEYWIVDPMDKTVETFINSSTGFQSSFVGKEGTVCSSVLPEFCVELQSIFG